VRVLRSAGMDIKSTMPVIRMWEMLAAMPTHILCDQVRDALKKRKLIDPLQIQYDGSRTTESIA
jgi:hypothetical protein